VTATAYLGNVVVISGKAGAPEWDLVLAGGYGNVRADVLLRVPPHPDWWHAISMPVSIEAHPAGILLTLGHGLPHHACFFVTPEGELDAPPEWVAFSLSNVKLVRALVVSAIRRHRGWMGVLTTVAAQWLGWRGGILAHVVEKYRANFRRWYFSSNRT
jgi:hypothetical protein